MGCFKKFKCWLCLKVHIYIHIYIFRNSQLYLCCNRKSALTINMLIISRWNFFLILAHFQNQNYFFRARQLFLMQSLLPLWRVCNAKLLMPRFWKSYISWVPSTFVELVSTQELFQSFVKHKFTHSLSPAKKKKKNSKPAILVNDSSSARNTN